MNPTSGVDDADEVHDALEVTATLPGRIVLAEPDGALHLGRGLEIHRSEDRGRTWRHVCSMPQSPLRRLAGSVRLGARLIRQEVRALVRRSDGGCVASNRQGVFVAGEGENRMRASRVDAGRLPLMPPMRLSAGPGGRLVFGEYGSPKTPRPVRLFASGDDGESFEPVRTLEAGSVLHVHNVVWDESMRHYWVLAGDFAREPGIGRLSEDLRSFDWLVKGEQVYRAVEVFDFGDRLLYATDSQLEANRLVSLDKRTGRFEVLREFDGSCIYACRFGGLMALTTTVEPSPINHSPWSRLWLSRDGIDWTCVRRMRKDRWNAHFFQFGSVVLPSGASDDETVIFSGQAIDGLDGLTCVARPAPDGPLAPSNGETLPSRPA